MEAKLEYKKNQLKNAISDFILSLKLDLSELDAPLIDLVKSGQVQKFEFTVELLWKVIKVFLDQIHGFDEKSPKSVIKRFFLLEYLSHDEYLLLVDSLNDRNKLSHIYDKAQFEEIQARLGDYGVLFEKIFTIIETS
ncbi:MAG: HI0074 family nucleotidyltransferase substrate-binding subunit [Spirochaetales bacterium]|nr:HI0074 family nucleotidyltransferase substrate-binding subunit [Spirochaetales bacterium]